MRQYAEVSTPVEYVVQGAIASQIAGRTTGMVGYARPLDVRGVRVFSAAEAAVVRG